MLECFLARTDEEEKVMELAYYSLLLVVFPPGSLANESNTSNEYVSGCYLHTPGAVENSWEAEGTPLSISIDVSVLNVRDVPDSGGSFGVDIL